MLHLAAALVLTKKFTKISMNLVSPFVLLKSNLDVQQTYLKGRFVEDPSPTKCDQNHISNICKFVYTRGEFVEHPGTTKCDQNYIYINYEFGHI